jgi:signal transduction histidine kinase
VCCEISDNGQELRKKTLSGYSSLFYNKAGGYGNWTWLSIAYDIIVNKHKGYIEVDSEAGKGTTFRLKLPEKQGV